ncbi:restriction endonuclease subunit S [Metamycoplasma hyosynoviae]|uniref:restriction endonuclease subunit S n=1 Tax=Metamycoplasma hyosynoviae TaxID=29559 RepID=UPI00235849FE|nr:restriction endonuclease subunit S [Metamycoplasma hyosynoviae]MDC8912077.1 restriction endonuclease subunit S [Metamycoplasma hyosynoviae]MDD7895432.1 restriction endonuclease subunit S [Metamycoplasma hyosynoviae]
MLYKLSEIASVIMGQSPKSSSYNSDMLGLPFLQGRTTFGDKYPYFDIWTTEWNKEANPNDILFTVRAPVGDLNIANTKIAIGRGIAAIRPKKVTTLYLYYLLQTNKHIFLTSSVGTIFDSINKDALESVYLDIHKEQDQHHIVNTIGSVDNLIENLTKQNEILMTLGISKINQFNNSYEKKSLNKIVKFEKGFEVGSSKYIEIYKKGLINYLRVGDLLSLGNTYIDEKDSDKIAKFEDILVAFDGSPGRNSIGLVGAYSSGIYNLKSTNKDKGLVYFEMNSDINKKIINNHSKGTTILHASKSINYLIYVDVDNNDRKVLNNYFNLILQNKKKINFLNKIKDNLLNKYF